ncbi:MAG TPA: asparagine synthase (glutamine-hydrolyzing) [Marinobacter sp.]|uniref:Glutamine amidotransferase type-2 domain-containing protein n=1 Tax=marine sediment metagenome TaxID=412755 RepID=A0A0F9R552_9ZZZZ|nr:asparagine synthase (glutamine-hydrolyzing) [Marinobacter sp.]
MCGIFGAFAADGTRPSNRVLHKMAHSIQHRGPDNVGLFSAGLCALGNCRLSIIDLSAAANQPQTSDDGQIIVVQNGEIYNYIELREELQTAGHRFNTLGDTEVLVRAYEAWGPDFVQRLNGMFAIAIYDRNLEVLHLYRDRLGVKPLFIHEGTNGQLLFASEIKSLLAAGVCPTPDMTAIAQYLALNYIPQPRTVLEGVRHLSPGHMATLDAENGLKIRRYWDLADVHCETHMTEAEAKAGLLTLLDDATRIRMRSDANFGAFLSGGLDSSSVVGFMSLYKPENLRSFSIGFDDPRFDESYFARQAAERFGTVHQMQIMPMETAAMWPRFIWHCDQPHGDVSFIPTDQVSAMAARDVKMVLTGDGGDELFAGYEKYLNLFPGGGTSHLKPGWEDDFVRSSGLLQGDQPDTLLTGALRDAFFDNDPYAPLTDEIRRGAHHDPINQVLLGETLTLLPGNNLVKPDRMAMANSLEVRSPFLDYRMAEFAFTVPGAMKLAGGETKAIYKHAVEPLLGKKLTYRKKQMFTVPVGEWFRQALAGFCHDTLLDGRLEARGIVDTSIVSQMISSHIAGTQNNTRQLRALISLEIWFRLFIDNDPDMLAQAARSARNISV